MQEPIKASVF